jgi:hypothetical protein
LTLSKIVRPGLSKPGMIDDALRHLHLRGRLNVSIHAATRTTDSEDPESDYDEEMAPIDDDNAVRPSDAKDDGLVRLWKSTITSRKAAGQDHDYIWREDPTLPNAYVEPDHDGVVPMDLEPALWRILLRKSRSP